MTRLWTSLLIAATLCAQTVTPLPQWAHSVVRRGEKPPPEEKYFHEPGNDDILGHYDTRYFHGAVTYDERSDTLLHMIRAYLDFFRENGLETWIAHGTLLGWWWNGKLLPWDWDVDTQVNTATLLRMGDYFNQTISNYTSPDGVKHSYLLDVNLYSRYRQRGEGKNIIDARWIDTRNGLYIDITGVSELNKEKEPGVLQCKNFHKYKTSDLYPLRDSMYEGVPAKIPYRYHDILIKEYGHSALIVQDFEDHDWDISQKTWVPDQQRIAATAKLTPEQKKKIQDDARKVREAEKKANAGRWG
ncbi:hypothetical protein FQN53_005308 [Emmonsiellopsis sp. PD_33]|nr:hypothetical protein FQN53_005308 [Emmonsiellopsis sp. PD_33]